MYQRRPCQNLPRSYREALDRLNGRASVKLCNNTVLFVNETAQGIGDAYVRLHNTIIVTFREDGNIVELDSGGWQTVTTKARMNNLLPNGFRVYSKGKRVWALYQNGEYIKDYEDGMEVNVQRGAYV